MVLVATRGALVLVGLTEVETRVCRKQEPTAVEAQALNTLPMIAMVILEGMMEAVAAAAAAAAAVVGVTATVVVLPMVEEMTTATQMDLHLEMMVTALRAILRLMDTIAVLMKEVTNKHQPMETLSLPPFASSISLTAARE